MTSFTPGTALLGGSLIGLAAAILLVGNGDIMGASGIVNPFVVNPIKNLTNPADGDHSWKLFFLVAFGVTANIYQVLSGGSPQIKEQQTESFVSLYGLAIAGFFIGYGTKLSNGCTTGHGICGMARFSTRSIVSVLIFMGLGFVTATMIDSVSAFYFLRGAPPMTEPTKIGRIVAWTTMVFLLGCGVRSHTSSPQTEPNESSSLKNVNSSSKNNNASAEEPRFPPPSSHKKILFSVVSGAVFAVGLAVSEMINNLKVLDFLDLRPLFARTAASWDPSLAFVMGAGLVISAVSYQYVHWSGKDFNGPRASSVDANLLGGSFLFGVGWGIGGLCPGPALYQTFVGQPQVMFCFMPLFAIGRKVATIARFSP